MVRIYDIVIYIYPSWGCGFNTSLCNIIFDLMKIKSKQVGRGQVLGKTKFKSILKVTDNKLYYKNQIIAHYKKHLPQ